jgi:hypothetical protein
MAATGSSPVSIAKGGRQDARRGRLDAAGSLQLRQYNGPARRTQPPRPLAKSRYWLGLCPNQLQDMRERGRRRVAALVYMQIDVETPF